jgi:phosphate:Na+ symporter
MDIEESIDEASVELENKHIDRVKRNACTAELGSIYLQTVANLERVGDHITNIAKSIKGYSVRKV